MSLRFIVMLLLAPIGCGTALVRPVYGLYWLVVFYYFRPDVWDSPGWFEPVMWTSVCCIIGWLLQVKDLRLSAPVLISAVLIVTMLLSSITARYSSEFSLNCTIDVIKLVAIMFLIIQLIRDLKSFYQFLWWNIIGNLWTLKSVLVLTVTLSDASRVDVSSAQGGGANYLAMLFVMGLPLFYYRYYYGSKFEKKASLILAPLYIIAMIGTGSRGGFLTLFATMAYLMARSKKVMQGLVAMAFIGIVLWAATPQEVWTRFMTTFGETGEERGFAANSRLALWEAAWAMFTESPVYGVGHDNFARLSARYTGFFAGDTPIRYNPGLEQSRGYIGFVAHSTWMQALAEGGLIGSIPFFMLFVNMFYNLRRVRKMKLDPKNQLEVDLASRTLEGIMIAFMVASSFGSHFKIDFLWWYFGAASALTIYAEGIKRRLARAERDRLVLQSTTAAPMAAT